MIDTKATLSCNYLLQQDLMVNYYGTVNSGGE